MKRTYILPETKTIVLPELMQTYATSNPGTGGASGGRAKVHDDIIVDDEEEENMTETSFINNGKRISDYIKIHSAWED